MKKIITSIFFLSVVLSCGDNLLDLTPISNPSLDTFYKTEGDMKKAVVAAYDALQKKGQYAWSYPFLMEVRSDNTFERDKGGSGGIFHRIDIFTLNPSNRVVFEAWKDGYAGIYAANIVLNKIDPISMAASAKTIMKGEMYFLRALTYFNLVRLFGAVPLITTITDPSQQVGVGRTSAQEVYQQIVKDLNAAVSALPSSHTDKWRATKGAANTLLGKVHLTLGNTQEAIEALKAVTGYQLIPDYANIFGVAYEFNKESIFEVSFMGGTGSTIIANGLGTGEGEGSPFPSLFGPVGDTTLVGKATFGNNEVTQNLYNAYEASDVRRNVNIGVFGGKYYPKKLIAKAKGDLDSDVNSIVLRYADVVLMLAEALNTQGYVANGEAFGLLNRIRTRAGLAPMTSADLADQASFKLEVEKQRRLELPFENHRWFDLIRSGATRAVAVMNAQGQTQPPGYRFDQVTKAKLLYPIPSTAIGNNTVLTQNPGY